MVYSDSTGECKCEESYSFIESTQLGVKYCAAKGHLQIISSKIDLSSATILEFSSFSSTETGSSSISVVITSGLYQDMLLSAAHGCYFYESEHHSRYCQALGNLCVLQHFDSSSSSCAFLDLIRRSGRSTTANNITGWYYTLPFMSYAAPALSVVQSTSIGMEVHTFCLYAAFICLAHLV